MNRILIVWVAGIFNIVKEIFNVGDYQEKNHSVQS